MKTVRLLMMAILLIGLFGAGNNALAVEPSATDTMTATGTIATAFAFATIRTLEFGTLTPATDLASTEFTVGSTPDGSCSANGNGICASDNESGAMELTSSKGNEVQITSTDTSNESATVGGGASCAVTGGGTEVISLFDVTYDAREGAVGTTGAQANVDGGQSGAKTPFTFTPGTGTTAIYVGGIVDVPGSTDPGATFICTWDVTANNT